MASKWGSSQEGQGNEERDRQVLGIKRRYGHSEELADTRSGSSSNSTNEMAFYLEPLLRKMIQEMIPPIIEGVIPPILQRYLSPCCGLSLNRQMGAPAGSGRALQLRFMNNLPSTIFTLSKITAEDGSPLRIALCDAAFQDLKVREDVSSVKVKICVLKGDFGSNESEDWTADEFKANILRQRDGKGPLLSGDTVVTLRNGVGSIDLRFADNSNWTRSGTFRIGAMVMESSLNGADIKEARTQPLRVKDNRGVAYKKHDRPSLNDEVWRLQKIAKNGVTHKNLSRGGIETVEDLLQLYTTNQASLREKIGNIPSKAWDTVIEHAKACEIDDDKRYIYQYFEAQQQQQQQSISLILNCIYEVVEVSFNGLNSRSLDSLNLEEKHLVEIIKQKAYKNLKDLKPIEATPQSLGRTFAVGQYGAPYQASLPPIECLPCKIQDQPQAWPNLSQPSTSTASLIDETSHNDQLASASQLLPHDQLPDMPLDWPLEWRPETYNGWPISGINEGFGSFFPPLTPLEPQNLFCPSNDYGGVGSNNVSSAVYIASKGKRNTVWNKIRSAVKWATLHAAIRKAKIFHNQH